MKTTILHLAATGLMLAVNGAWAGAASYATVNLVSNQTGVAQHTDANLVNAWGIAFNPNGPVWVANNHSGTSTLYDGSGTAISGLPSVNVPGANGGTGSPTGIVFNSSSDFNVAPSSPAAFIFANEDGTLAAWSPKVDLLNAKIVGGKIPFKNPIYKGLAMAGNGGAHYLYVTDFRNARVQVFDSSFNWVNAKKKLGCEFATTPALPSGFAPFGIRNIGGVLYVTYAKQDAAKEDNVSGAGLGYVYSFDANGCQVGFVAGGGNLNAPWAIALAPANFGGRSNQLLIGNFGDGAINAYIPKRVGGVNVYSPSGSLVDAKGKKILIDGLWDLAFGNGVAGQKTNSLFFTAGPDGETNGLYGKIEAVNP